MMLLRPTTSVVEETFNEKDLSQGDAKILAYARAKDKLLNMNKPVNLAHQILENWDEFWNVENKDMVIAYNNQYQKATDDPAIVAWMEISGLQNKKEIIVPQLIRVVTIGDKKESFLIYRRIIGTLEDGIYLDPKADSLQMDFSLMGYISSTKLRFKLHRDMANAMESLYGMGYQASVIDSKTFCYYMVGGIFNNEGNMEMPEGEEEPIVSYRLLFTGFDKLYNASELPIEENLEIRTSDPVLYTNRSKIQKKDYGKINQFPLAMVMLELEIYQWNYQVENSCIENDDVPEWIRVEITTNPPKNESTYQDYYAQMYVPFQRDENFNNAILEMEECSTGSPFQLATQETRPAKVASLQYLTYLFFNMIYQCNTSEGEDYSQNDLWVTLSHLTTLYKIAYKTSNRKLTQYQIPNKEKFDVALDKFVAVYDLFLYNVMKMMATTLSSRPSFAEIRTEIDKIISYQEMFVSIMKPKSNERAMLLI